MTDQRKIKPEDTLITQIVAMEFFVCGIGTDQKIYMWKDLQWVVLEK